MKKINILTAVYLLLFLVHSSVSSGTEGSSFSDIQRILDNDRLLVAILAKDAPPMIMTDSQGGMTGFEADLARDIGEKIGVPVEFIRTAETYDEVIDIVAQKKADIAVSFLSSDVRRAKKVLFSKPYVKQNHKFFFNRELFVQLKRKYGIESVEEIAAKPGAATVTFGVLQGSVYQAALQREFPRLQIQLYQTLPEIMQAVRTGKILAGLHGQLQLEFFMRMHPETAIYVGIDPKVRHPSDISIAVRPDAPHLLQWINIYLTNQIGTLDVMSVVKKYQQILP
ncbi:substrate-binding periplasmic protein [Candidatus Electrothrix sp.]|uniref:substrate-binding periplasmic protein n=1 Tax=Candidatus Electrothrix sp. TaxID=2170559 RepID=UPI004056936C